MPKSPSQKDRPPDANDLAVIGGGTAGAAAASLAAKAGLRVVMIERCEASDSSRVSAWVAAAAEPLLEKLDLTWNRFGAEPFRGVSFHTETLQRRQDVRLGRPMAYFVDLAAWNRILRQSAAERSAVCMYGVAVCSVQAREDHVAVECLSGRGLKASVALLADGPLSASANAVGLVPSGVNPGEVAIQLDWTAARTSRLPTGVLHFVLGIEGGRAFAVFAAVRGREYLTVFARDEALAREHMQRLVGRLRDLFGVALPARLDASCASARIVPTARALEIESHVGKRTIAIGDAGGFVTAATREGIFPAMWSAALAVDVIAEALRGGHVQDKLRRFDTLWRTTMADYLRPPNTDLQFLLPLVFSNKQMAERLAAAFLRG